MARAKKRKVDERPYRRIYTIPAIRYPQPLVYDEDKKDDEDENEDEDEEDEDANEDEMDSELDSLEEHPKRRLNKIAKRPKKSSENDVEANTSNIDFDSDKDFSDADEFNKDQSETGIFKKKLSRLFLSAFTEKKKSSLVIGSFAGHGNLPSAPNPGVVIEELGMIRLPLDSTDAERIISHSAQAPFGKKNKTLVDLSVRKTWQIDGAKIQFRNREWANYLQDIVIPKVAGDLGLEPSLVDAHLYKLLLYGEGGHFESHQDTEKEPRMFGTLIIVLPSLFTGGSVTASHGSSETVFDTAPNSEFGTSYTCIYSDVFHKVHPVTSGYRFVLSYNLIFKPPSEPIPKAPVANKKMQALQSLLQEWSGQLDTGKNLPLFVAHVLDHKYSQVGLNSNNIKGKDRAKVDFCKSMADNLGFEIYFAQLDIVDSPEAGERTYEIKDAISPAGKTFDFKQMELEKFDTMPPMGVQNWHVDKKSGEEGFLGNEEGEVTNYYYRTIILMWPRSQHLYMSVRALGLKHALTRLNSIVESGSRNKAGASSKKTDIEFAVAASVVFFRLGHLWDSKESKLAGVLTASAFALGDATTFSNTIKNASSRWITLNDCISGVNTFGFEVLRDALDIMLSKPSESYGDERKSTWRCQFVLDLMKAIPNNQELHSWARRQVFVQLSKVDSVDKAGTNYIIEIAKRNGFLLCQEALSGIVASLEKSKDLNKTRDKLTPCRFILKFFQKFQDDMNACDWCSEQLALAVATLHSRSSAEDIQSINQFLQMCSTSQQLSYVPGILKAFQRPSYEVQYFTNVITPITALLRETLQRKSLTFTGEPYASFARHFLQSGANTLRRPTPPLPVDFAITTSMTICDYKIKEFLASSIRHTLNLEWQTNHSNSIKKDLKSYLGYRLSMDRNGSTWKIQKLPSPPRQDGKLSLTTAQQQQWRRELCDLKTSCEYCRKAEVYLDWYQDRKEYRILCSAFGDKETVEDIIKAGLGKDGMSPTSPPGTTTTSIAVETAGCASSSSKPTEAAQKHKRIDPDTSVINLTSSPIQMQEKSRKKPRKN